MEKGLAMEEVFIILSGKAWIRVGKEEAVFEKEDAVIVRVGKVHQMKNIGKEDVEYIAIGVSRGKGGKTVVV